MIVTAYSKATLLPADFADFDAKGRPLSPEVVTITEVEKHSPDGMWKAGVVPGYYTFDHSLVWKRLRQTTMRETFEFALEITGDDDFLSMISDEYYGVMGWRWAAIMSDKIAHWDETFRRWVLRQEFPRGRIKAMVNVWEIMDRALSLGSRHGFVRFN